MFELVYIVISGPFIADYAVWAIVVSFVSFGSVVESCLIDNHTTSSFIYICFMIIQITTLGLKSWFYGVRLVTGADSEI